MAKIKIDRPYWDRSGSQVIIPANTQNVLVEEYTLGDLSEYQRSCPIFEFLRMENNYTFKKHKIYGNPIIWQKGRKDCKKDERGKIGMKSAGVLTPCSVSAFTKWCPEEVMDSCFQSLYSVNSRGQKQWQRVESMLVAPMIRKWNELAARSLLSIQLLGQLFNFGQGGINVDSQSMGNELIKDFIDQANVCQGLLKKIEMQYPECKAKDCLPENIDEGCDNGIDILALFECFMCQASSALQKIIHTGGFRGLNGNPIQPVFIVSSNLIFQLANKLKSVGRDMLNNAYACKDGMILDISRERMASGKWQYYICGVKVVPVDEFCDWNEFLEGDFYFAALTVTRNMQLGMNFGTQQNVNGELINVGVTIERENSIKNGERGTYCFDSNALVAQDLAAKELFIGDWKYYA